MAPTLARRYIFKLLANLLSVPVYLLMEALLPRALGPSMYGNYSFATNLFQQFSGFLDMGTSTCFYNLLSRNQNQFSIFAWYIRICCLIAAAILAVGIFTLWQPAGRLLMPDIPLWLAPLAAIWALFTWLGRVLRSTNDALGATIPSEIWRAGLSLAAAALLAALFFSGYLNIATLFVQQYLLLSGTCAAFWLVSKRAWQQAGIQPDFKVAQPCRRSYRRIFFAYSHPLLVQALLSFIMLTAERWLLQWFDGSSQQGFYALSQKVSMACFLFVSAMTPLLMREFSLAWGRGDLNAIGSLLTRFAPALYVMAAYFSCFTVVEARALVEIFGGAEFAAAVLPVQIMALYPLHQAYGQLASSVFHASGKTHILRNITACECVYGLVLAWLLLAPANLWGFNLGATGLAIKTVSVQFLSVNIYLWLIAQFVPFHFWRNLGHQLLCLLCLLFLAWGCRQISLQITGPESYFTMRFILSGFFYTIAVSLSALLAPRLLGMTRRDAREILRRFQIWRRSR